MLFAYTRLSNGIVFVITIWHKVTIYFCLLRRRTGGYNERDHFYAFTIKHNMTPVT